MIYLILEPVQLLVSLPFGKIQILQALKDIFNTSRRVSEVLV